MRMAECICKASDSGRRSRLHPNVHLSASRSPVWGVQGKGWCPVVRVMQPGHGAGRTIMLGDGDVGVSCAVRRGWRRRGEVLGGRLVWLGGG